MKYNKAIGATVGALFAWAAVWGYETIGGLDASTIENFAIMVGGVLGTIFAPKNKEA